MSEGTVPRSSSHTGPRKLEKAVAVSGVCSWCPRNTPGKSREKCWKIFPKSWNAANSRISGTGKGKPAGNLGSTLPEPCLHLPCGVLFEINSSSLLDFSDLWWWRCAPSTLFRAELKATDLRWQSPICSFLRFSAKIFGFLRKSAVAVFLWFPAPSKSLNFQERGWICEDLRFSSAICLLGSLCHLSSVPLSAPSTLFSVSLIHNLDTRAPTKARSLEPVRRSPFLEGWQPCAH